ncbi:hypothetical protein SGPA1_40146 [Streptomyces misionensis JCM 4497]
MSHVSIVLAGGVESMTRARHVLSKSDQPEFDPEVLTPQGGAIASGARLAGAVAHQLARKGGGVGGATLRIGVGRGLALVLER